MKPIMNIIKFAAAKLKLLNMRTSMIGSLRNHSQPEQADRCGYDQGRDEMRAEPIVFLAFVQEDLERSHTQRQKRDSNVVHPDAPPLYATEERGIFDQDVSQIQSEKNRRQRDEKYPAPGVAVRNPTAQHRPDRRGENGSNAIDSKRLAALLWGKRIVENRLCHRLQSTATDALHGSKQQQ
jgi:hypothetical protein